MVAGPLRARMPPPDLPDMALLARQARELYPRQVATGDEDLSAAKFFIPTLPGLPSSSTLTMYGGHLPSAPPKNGVKDTKSDAHLYFFMLRSRHIADMERNVLWFNGGPGCSSFDGSLMEVGPLRLVPGGKGQLKEVEGAWNEYTNMIFIDQPVGTGYAYMATNNYVHELPEASQHVIEFLVQFYSVFPEFSKHDTWIAGESYAGQYIPYIADAILESTRIPTRLKGLLIGNGWIDPYNQYPAYLEFALKAGVVKAGSATEARVQKDVDTCMDKLNGNGGIKNVKIHNGECENILGSITDSTVQNVNGQNMCVNNYDVRLTDTHPACGMNWPPDLVDIQPYLQRSDVKSAFHANRKDGGWVECNGQVGANFWVQESKPAVFLLPKLLEQLPILFFAGDQDLICNYVGIERMIENLEWNGEKGFGNITAQDWSVNGKPAGTWTTARNLTYVKISDASHMVPYDQPLASHDMLLRFLDIDLLGAAGPAAQVPSRVGDEQEAVLGETHPNGTAVSGSSGTSGSLEDGELLSVGKDSSTGGALETMVNVGSALVIIALMGLGLAIFLVVRRRMNRRKSSSHHKRRVSTGRGMAVGESTEEEGEGEHELEVLVDGEEEREQGYRDRDEKGKGRVRDEEEIFGLGGSDDDEEEGRRRRG